MTMLHYGDGDDLLIWLHGLGAGAEDFAWLPERLDLYGLRVWLPQAPPQAVTLNGGQVMPSWFDLRPGRAEVEADLDSLSEASRRIHLLLRDSGSRGRVFLGGFSQGAALALHAGLLAPRGISGLIAFSGWLPAPAELRGRQLSPTAALVAHGTADVTVPIPAGRLAARSLEDFGCHVDWRESPGIGHTVPDDWVEALRGFLAAA